MDDLIKLLRTLLYKTITVYLVNYESVKFTGVLYNIQDNYIFLTLVNTNNNKTPKKTPINFTKRYSNFNSNSNIIIHNNLIAQIPINKIDSIVYIPTG